MPTLALTTSNAQIVGGNVLLAGLQASQKNGNGLFTPLAAQAAPLPSTYVLSRFLEEQIARLGSTRHSQLAMQPMDVQTMPCQISGDITVSSDASSVTEAFNACSDLAGESVSGVIAISGFASTPSSFSASVSINLTFSVSGFPDQNFTGSFGISETGLGSSVTTITISGANLVLRQGASTEDLGNFSFSTTIDTSTSDTTNSVSFMYSSAEIGGTVSVTTLTPFQTSPGKTFPHAGAIQITGVNSSAIRITVNGDESGLAPQVAIQLDADGNGVFDLTLNRNWSDLSA